MMSAGTPNREIQFQMKAFATISILASGSGPVDDGEQLGVAFRFRFAP